MTERPVPVLSLALKWSAVLSAVVLEQERMLPTLLDLLDGADEAELRPLTALLRNLARHAPNKDLVGQSRAATNSPLCNSSSKWLGFQFWPKLGYHLRVLWGGPQAQPLEM